MGWLRSCVELNSLSWFEWMGWLRCVRKLCEAVKWWELGCAGCAGELGQLTLPKVPFVFDRNCLDHVWKVNNDKIKPPEASWGEKIQAAQLSSPSSTVNPALNKR
ncbi:uncharacterized protein PGTG_17280 [Puccinia graminis f. sp. tritici CRL 75-36-700-3]|uniref:Uncharacterized protein n=1 Tax=Puccinia graminis f. sp. tritici (strain CRL 75-36-700-3 / race SCCL) TaxID=418459 RepID=E3L383_PUCGT|nr:uncharacterized protein PGTG_17280 [Puccinia graminis f. sp. tritici CRL 75-36-700-3]EFP91008.1 hypothetical protein PGTG_17280 [Puccinia graminis f. sp. tritici CRL 75-36-700-3]